MNADPDPSYRHDPVEAREIIAQIQPGAARRWWCLAALAEKLLGVTYRSARRTVEKLVAAGMLRQVGAGSYDKLFVAEAVLQIVGGR